jgi:hypothetical protein
MEFKCHQNTFSFYFASALFSILSRTLHIFCGPPNILSLFSPKSVCFPPFLKFLFPGSEIPVFPNSRNCIPRAGARTRGGLRAGMTPPGIGTPGYCGVFPNEPSSSFRTMFVSGSRLIFSAEKLRSQKQKQKVFQLVFEMLKSKLLKK